MSRFIPYQQVVEQFLVSERALSLHVRRGNLPFRGEAEARLYDLEVLSMLFLPRAEGAAVLLPGSLGSLRMGAPLAGSELGREPATPRRRRRRAHGAERQQLGPRPSGAQEA